VKRLKLLALDFVLFASVIFSFPFLWLARKVLPR
jgi:hypothetical protein